MTPIGPGGLEGAAPSPAPGSRELPLRVSELVRATNHVLDSVVRTTWVEGEVDSLLRAASGHCYFALKDGQAQLRAVMWKSDAARLRFKLENGQVLRCRGRLEIYPRDGKLQLHVQLAEPAGQGAEALAFEQLKQRLAAEGLFAVERKRPLPRLPRRIGVVTSRHGAAVKDIIRAVERRFPVPILIADCRVQGDDAPVQIARALALIGGTDVDVVIVGRGGGSAGDLGAFNDERVVRAIVACPVPVISAVGHEVDLSLADLAADVRAATPTMAGEMAVPVRAELAEALRKQEQRLHRELAHKLATARQELDHLRTRLDHRVAARLGERQRRLADVRRRLDAAHPRQRLTAHRATLIALVAAADRALQRGLTARQRGFGALAARLDALSPLRVLERGYALATAGGHVLADAAQVAVGDEIAVRLARGQLACRVERARGDDEPS